VRLATGWTVRESNPVGTRFSACPYRPWGPPSLLYNGYRVFPREKVRPGRAADHSSLLVPRSWKSRAITVPTLWATTGRVMGSLSLPLLPGHVYSCISEFACASYNTNHGIALCFHFHKARGVHIF